jgi:hypothetical protein
MWSIGAGEVASPAVSPASHRHDPPARSARPITLDRRRLLRNGAFGLGAAAAGAVVAACSEESSTQAEGVGAGPEQRLQALFPRDIAYVPAATPFRLPYTLVDAEGIPLAEIEGPATFTVRFDGEQVGDAEVVEVHDDGVPRPYLPLMVTFPRPGLYDIEAEVAGEVVQSQVQVVTPDQVEQPLVGATLPSAETATPGRTFDVDPICTAAPQCPFHEVNLSDVIGTGVPVVVLLATPAYCQTTACGPILDLLIEEAGGRDDLVVIHSEVYQDPKTAADLSQAKLAPLPSAYRMGWEPSLFVTDAASTLVARGDIVVDRVEMRQMLDLAV